MLSRPHLEAGVGLGRSCFCFIPRCPTAQLSHGEGGLTEKGEEEKVYLRSHLNLLTESLYEPEEGP